MSQLVEKSDFSSSMDAIRKESKDGVEFWYAREIQEKLGYSRWESFSDVIAKARMACQSAGVDPHYHFQDTTKKVAIGSGAMASRADCIVSRYACYLIAMNGESSKPEIGLAQTYEDFRHTQSAGRLPCS